MLDHLEWNSTSSGNFRLIFHALKKRKMNVKCWSRKIGEFAAACVCYYTLNSGIWGRKSRVVRTLGLIFSDSHLKTEPVSSTSSGLEVKYLFCTPVRILQCCHKTGATLVWSRACLAREPLGNERSCSVCLRPVTESLRVKVVHVRLYIVGEEGTAFQWTTGNWWKVSDFDDLLWISNISQLIHLKLSPGPLALCG